MESIHVRNFLVLREVDLPIDKFIVIIGRQASGKSLLAKLLYFFRKFMREIYVESINKGQVKRQVERDGVALFERYFPRYAWGNDEFELVYRVDDVEVSLRRGRNNQGELRIKLDYAKKLADLHRRFKFEYKKYAQEHEDVGRDVWREFKHAHLEDFMSQYLRPSVFIPAGRSFFANLQKNVFSFLASNIDIDPFIKEFGLSYESSKRLGPRVHNLQNEVAGLMRSILMGKYVFEDDQDWIETQGRRINLANASSGQQEALPMLLMLSTLPFISGQRSTFFIEEPEVHLFPKAQQNIVDLFSLLYAHGQGIVITTHSPYILTAMNNLILAGDIVRREKSLSGKVKSVIGSGYPIRYEDVGAYFIEGGSLKSIKDDDTRLIGVSLIDEVSDEFARLFNALLDIEEQV